MDRPNTWATVLFGAGIAAVIAAISIPAVHSPPDWSAWYIIALGGLAVAFFLGTLSLIVLARRYQPLLVVTGTVRELRGIHFPASESAPRMRKICTPSGSTPSIPSTFATTHVGPDGATGYFVYAQVENREGKRGSSDALSVIATLKYLSVDGTQLYEINGRWAHTLQDSLSEQLVRATEITLHANGNPALLDIAFKYFEDEKCFAFNDENAAFAPTDLRYRSLGSHPVVVELELNGSGVKTKATFDLSHSGSNSLPTLTLRS